MISACLVQDDLHSSLVCRTIRSTVIHGLPNKNGSFQKFEIHLSGEVM